MGRRSKSKQAQEQFGGGMPQQVQINPDDLEDVTCQKCGSHLFQQVIIIKKVSAIVSPTGQEGIVPMGGPFACIRCGFVLSDSLPEELTEDSEDTPGEPQSSIITTDL